MNTKPWKTNDRGNFQRESSKHSPTALCRELDQVVVLVSGEPPEGLLDGFADIARNADPSSEYAALFLFPGIEPGLIVEAVTCASPLIPIVNMTGRACPRADFSAPMPSRSALREGWTAIDEIRAKLRLLPPLPEGEDRDPLTLCYLAFSRDGQLNGVIDPHVEEMVSYPLLTGIPGSRDILESLAESGLFERRFFERLLLCERCGSARALAREVCPSCNSANLEEIQIVHHYRCGHQASRSEFDDGENLICPKCRHRLRHYGVDYDTPGEMQRCRTCGKTAAEPLVSFLCADCSHETRGVDIQTREYSHYRLTKAGELAAEEGRLPGREIEELLSRLAGWRSPHNLALILESIHRVHTRYERPYTVVSIPVPDLEQARQELGATGITRLRRALVDMLRESLRSADFVALHEGRIVMLLPETDPANGEAVMKRLSQQIRESFGEKMRLEASLVGYDQSPSLIAMLSKR
ncbi:hypothetical protein [Thiocystis violascens]|uniref:Thaumarchaeal output domain-containing protein n=1 Tax=Thiocystis violascens (strain ATCC 17096 / DSM 198 / 6111) TaxID=765911 RepID=I3YD66_THIV6|nr:hypothetical protein [Thiocystis violascens]AFL74934.1 hypothetical protein Thivi_3054 [Thiocystis violascens DSM 198]